MIYIDKIYRPEGNENALEFVHRLIAGQSDREPLHIVETLVEIALLQLKDEIAKAPKTVENAVVEPDFTEIKERMKVTLRHSGRPIDDRMVWQMGNHTDHVNYRSDGNDAWKLVIRRDIPPLFVTKR